MATATLPSPSPLCAVEERNAAVLRQLLPAPDTTNTLLRLLETRFRDAVQDHESGEVKLFNSHVDVPLKLRLETGASYNVLAVTHDVVSLQQMKVGDAKTFEAHHQTFEPFTLNDSRIELTHPKATASVLLNAVEKVTRAFLRAANSGTTTSIEMTIVSSFPLDVMTIQSAFFREVFPETPENAEDPLNAVDLARLIVIGLERRQIAVTVTAVVYDSVASVLAGLAGHAPGAPRCLVSASIDRDLVFAFQLPNAEESGFQGGLLDVDVSRFSGWIQGVTEGPSSATLKMSTGTYLPLLQADLEVAFSSDGNQVGKCLLDKMTAGRYIPEIVRKLFLDIYQHEAPALTWTANTLSLEECIEILNDETPSYEATKQVMAQAWQWDDARAAALLRALVSATFNRSAWLSGVVLATICKHTGRLQPALGGLSVSMTGRLLACDSYRALLRMHVDDIFSKDTSQLIRFHYVEDAPIKGAAILAYKLRNKF